MYLLPITDKKSFLGAIDNWYAQCEKYLNESAFNPETRKSRYIHKRLRSTYKSLERNAQYLLTWYDNMKLKLLNTNNQLENTFTNLKTSCVIIID